MATRAAFVLAALLPFTAGTASASETWSWTTAEFSVLATSRWQATVHAMGRTGHGLSTGREERGGGTLKFRIAPHVTLTGAYIYQRDRNDAGLWIPTHRLLGGAETRVIRKGAAILDGRGLLDHFMVNAKLPYNRYRLRARFTTTRRFGPYAAVESYFVREGVDTVRYYAGFRWLATSQSALEMGYLYDARRPVLGPPRHVIETRFSYDGFRINHH